MARDLRLNLDLSTREAQRNLRDAAKATSDLGDEFDDTRSKGDRVADAIRLMSQQAETELLQARAAADRLGAALGDDLVAEVKEAGGSIDGLVQDLKRVGLSYQDIEADAESLGLALRETRERGKELGIDLNDGAIKASGGLDRVRDSGDQSRAVLGSMVGGSVADLAALGGVGGTVGQVFDQMASYATEGQLSLSSLAKVAGPLAGIGIVTMGISAALKAQAAQTAEVKRQTELLIEVEEKRRDGDAAGVIEALAEEWKGTLPILREYGMGVKEIDAVLGGNTETIEILRAKMKEYDLQLLNTKDMTIEEIYALDDKRAALNNVVRNLEEANTAQGNAREQIEQTDESTRAWTEYIGSTTLGAQDDLTVSINRYARAQENARDAARKRQEAEESLYSTMRSMVDKQYAYEEAVDSGEDAVASFNEVLKEGKGDLEAIDDAARDGARALIDQAAAFAESKGAALDSKEGTRLQVEELYRLAIAMDPSSPLRARLVEYINELQSIPSSIDTMLNLRISSGATTTKDGDAIGVRGGARYKGGPVKAGVPYVVGENPDGSFNSTTEVVVPEQNGTVLNAAQSREALSGNGGTTTIIQHFPAGSTPRDVTAAQRRYRRTQGPT